MGGSIIFFVESKTFEFSVEEGGTYYMLRIYERNKDSLRSIFMGKKSAKRLLTYVEDLMTNAPPKKFARTFRDGNMVFILQLGFNAHGSFLLISELVHGRQKGFIIALEGKLGSGWRGFGFHLRKVIAPDTLVIKPPSQSVLNPIMQKFRQQKSFLLTAVDSDQKNNGGSGKGMQLMPNIQNLTKLNLSNQNHDSRDKGARKEGAVPGVEIMHEIKDDSLNGTISPLSLEVPLSLECG